MTDEMLVLFPLISSELNRVLPSPIQDLSKYVANDFREEVNKHDIYRIYVS